MPLPHRPVYSPFRSRYPLGMRCGGQSLIGQRRDICIFWC